MLHLFDRTDKNITLVSKKCIMLRFRCSLLAINRKHCPDKARPERLWMQSKKDNDGVLCSKWDSVCFVLLANTFRPRHMSAWCVISQNSVLTQSPGDPDLRAPRCLTTVAMLIHKAAAAVLFNWPLCPTSRPVHVPNSKTSCTLNMVTKHQWAKLMHCRHDCNCPATLTSWCSKLQL